MLFDVRQKLDQLTMKLLLLVPFLALSSYASGEAPTPKRDKAPARSQNAANVSLAQSWERMADEARKDAGVEASSSHTGAFGGVYTTTFDRLYFVPPNRAEDPAKAFHDACAKRFAKWATENGAEMSSTDSGDQCLRIKGKNGDYLSTLYLPPSDRATQGTIVIVFVDAVRFDGSGFGAKRPAQQAEQAGTGQPATRPQSKSEGGDKPQPEAEGRSR